MYQPFQAGDACPECTTPLARHSSSVWTLFLVKPFLKCPRCKLTIRQPSGVPHRGRRDNVDTRQPEPKTERETAVNLMSEQVPAHGEADEAPGFQNGVSVIADVCPDCGQPLDKCSFRQRVGRENVGLRTPRQ